MNRRAPPSVQVTDELLRLAFRQIRLASWPRTFEAVLASPVHRACLRGIARNLERRRLQRGGGSDLFDEGNPS